MLFTSLGYALFLPLVFLLHWRLPHRARWIALLAASVWFYLGFGAPFLLALLYAALLSYGAGLLIEKAAGRARKALLAAAVCLTLAPLFAFKYFNFFSQSLAAVLGVFSVPLRPAVLKLAQPVGISFYTFQTIGYEVDVYRGRIRAERHPGLYALFVCFFPQLVSGPINRAGALLPQLRRERVFDYGTASRGLRLLVWGFFKKMVIADNLSALVDAVYAAPADCGGFALLLAALLFSIEIYCDFSGYSDIAIGSARLFGVELAENFKSPYFAGSVREFWGRWHMSLSTWFRDYVYIPLGGNRVGRARHSLNLLLTFLASGLWHGADWSFVVWGGMHGAARIAEDRLGLSRSGDGAAALRALRALGVFAFTTLAWIFFRADTLGDACFVVTHLFSGVSAPAAYLREGLAFTREHLPLSKKLLAAALLMLAAYDYASLRTDVLAWLDRRPAPLRWGLYLLVGMLTLLCHYHGNVSFIYFQF